jgi:three-Cys-motif partner protein
LFDIRPSRIKALTKLRDREAAPRRVIEVLQGDFNTEVIALLKSGKIRDKAATFALLDQHTWQCEWATVEALAKHKAEGLKIELFYFLATGWLTRSLTATKNTARLDRWWGDSTWRNLLSLHHFDQAKAMVGRLQGLGYKYVDAFQIFSRRGKGARVMYYMIHATDHDDAPSLMRRAYNKIDLSDAEFEQLEMKMPK